MEIIVHQKQVLDNEEVFDCKTTYNSFEDLRCAILEIIENWCNMQGNDAIISCPNAEIKVGFRIVLTCATNKDIETFEVKDIILAHFINRTF
jgi:hypothetical protein